MDPNQLTPIPQPLLQWLARFPESPLLVITLGEVYSINIPAVHGLMKNHGELPPTIVIGSRNQWNLQGAQLGLEPYPWLTAPHRNQGHVCFCDVGFPGDNLPPHALPAHTAGKIAVNSLEIAGGLAMMRKSVAVLTAPINKARCQAVGFPYPGQTEFFAAVAGQDTIMILAGPRLIVGLATNHLPLNRVSSAVKAPLLRSKISLFHQALCNLRQLKDPRIAVAGLNPHCGEDGHFGIEDRDVVAPAVRDAAETGIAVSGPFPADTLFFQATEGRFDGVLALYHDQGLAPLKLLHFYDAVNITGGLPFLRVSPDHGPASDLYGSEFNAASFRQAFNHCIAYLNKGIGDA